MSEQNDEKQLADAKKLPIAERVTHSNWKVRSAAFEDISDACAKARSPDDKIFGEYGKDQFNRVHTTHMPVAVDCQPCSLGSERGPAILQPSSIM